MKVKDFIKMDIDMDVYDNICDELGIAFVGPQALTKEGKEYFKEVLDYEITINKAGNAIVDVDKDDWEDRLQKAKEFFESCAGYCPEEDYNKWFTDEEEPEAEPQTLKEKKAKTLNLYKDNPERLVYSMTEIMFDIMTNKPKDLFMHDADSREIWLELADWAWEFQYYWDSIGGSDNLDNDYLFDIDDFAEKKFKEYMKELKGE